MTVVEELETVVEELELLAKDCEECADDAINDIGERKAWQSVTYRIRYIIKRLIKNNGPLGKNNPSDS